jgi:diadenylate cyclase
MKENYVSGFFENSGENVVNYFLSLQENPLKLIPVILDIAIVIYVIVKIIKFAKDSRGMQLIKGILFFIIITWLSGILNLRIVHSVLTSILPSGVVALIVIFQPEIRRALEQLGTNKLTNFFGMEKSIETKTREDIYKIVIAVCEMAKTKTGALIVIQRDISLSDIIATGIEIDSEISPQLIVNIFVPKTPLHDGAIVIRNNKIAAGACILPLANNADISKELGTRHRAAVGISKESDAIAIVVSEESGKISIAKDGTLIADVKEEALKNILIKNIITNRLEDNKKSKLKGIKKIKEIKETKNNKEENTTNENK